MNERKRLEEKLARLKKQLQKNTEDMVKLHAEEKQFWVGKSMSLCLKNYTTEGFFQNKDYPTGKDEICLQDQAEDYFIIIETNDGIVSNLTFIFA